MEKIPKIGVGVIIAKDGKVLLGQRKNAHGTGSWCPPGGHLEFMETIEECARREVIEETGVSIKNIQKPVFTEDFFKAEDRHYITMFVTVEWDSGEPKLIEPDSASVGIGLVGMNYRLRCFYLCRIILTKAIILFNKSSNIVEQPKKKPPSGGFFFLYTPTPTRGRSR